MTKQIGSAPRALPNPATNAATVSAPSIVSGPVEGVKTSMRHDGAVGVQLSSATASNPFADLGGSKASSFNSTILRQVLGSLWLPADEGDKREATDRMIVSACAALKAFKPADEIEGMMAAQAVALHSGAMECFRRSMIPEQSSEAATRLRRDGANLSRAMLELIDAFDRRRGKGSRHVVRVERVVVQNGGQAVVGNVTTAPGSRLVAGEGEGT